MSCIYISLTISLPYKNYALLRLARTHIRTIKEFRYILVTSEVFFFDVVQPLLQAAKFHFRRPQSNSFLEAMAHAKNIYLFVCYILLQFHLTSIFILAWCAMNDWMMNEWWMNDSLMSFNIRKLRTSLKNLAWNWPTKKWTIWLKLVIRMGMEPFHLKVRKS